MTSRTDEPVHTTLQSLILPEQGVCTERELYVRLGRGVGLSEQQGVLRFATSGVAQFNTWFNLFNVGKWRGHCGLESLSLSLSGTGEFEISIFLASPHHSWDRMVNEIITLTEETPVILELSHALDSAYDEGILFFELQALASGELTRADWQTADAPRRVPEVAVSITTFKREAAVTLTTERFNRYIEHSPHRDHIRLIVVDNGQSVTLPDTDRMSVLPNENLGGAGGFARGQLAAADSGASHCVFMDDDASIHMASLDRTYQFLAYAEDPATAVAGAMNNAQHRWAIWENGAVFNSRCRPLYMGTDLRDMGQVLEMEFETTRKSPANFYGGWWYFAFPLAEARHMPFPFFVRGDDVSFSLVHDFNIVTLNGVVSFQESFTDKESPQTWYLDLRSHMAHHLSLPGMEIGRFGVLKIAVWFFLRNLPRMHYDTLSAINLAVEDVMKGPDFFDENADMAQRRADLKALTREEAWKDVEPETRRRPVRKKPPIWPVRLLHKLTLNGHLVPFFSLLGRKITILAENRGGIGFVWGASEITYLSTNERKCYTVHHSKRKFLRESLRLAGNGLAFLRQYDRLRQLYRDGYQDLTSESYWRQKLGMTKTTDEGQAA